MSVNILQQLATSKQLGQKRLGILLDPDKVDFEHLHILVRQVEDSGVDYILVGGSLLTTTHFERIIKQLKHLTKVPVILFPSGVYQISADADAILFLSLISGRNPELLIGRQVEAAPVLQQMKLEVIPTGYMLVDGGRQTTASYMSNTTPIPANKPEIAACTALAGQYLGQKLIYLDAGSGADRPVPAEMIKAVRNSIQIPIIAGGGIRTPELAYDAANAGADLIIVGSLFEKDSSVIQDFINAVKATGKHLKNTDYNV